MPRNGTSSSRPESPGTVLSPWLRQSLRMIGSSPAGATLFVVGSLATMVGLTLDGAAVGLHRGVAQLWRGSLNSILKLAVVGVLVLASTRTATGLIFAWASALVVASLICMPMLRLDPSPAGEGSLSHRRALVHRFGKLSLTVNDPRSSGRARDGRRRIWVVMSAL